MNHLQHDITVASFYNNWATQDYTETEGVNGCYAHCVIDDVIYIDSELYGQLNSRNHEDVVKAFFNNELIGGTGLGCYSYSKHAQG